jgi:hypothetical protein
MQYAMASVRCYTSQGQGSFSVRRPKLRSGAQIIADLIAAWDLAPVFHVPGEGILDILDALATRHPGARLVTARHEGGMAFMASGAAHGGDRRGAPAADRRPGRDGAFRARGLPGH